MSWFVDRAQFYNGSFSNTGVYDGCLCVATRWTDFQQKDLLLSSGDSDSLFLVPHVNIATIPKDTVKAFWVFGDFFFEGGIDNKGSVGGVDKYESPAWYYLHRTLFRYLDPNNFYLAEIVKYGYDGLTRLNLYKKVGGVFSFLGKKTLPIALDYGDLVTLRVLFTNSVFQLQHLETGTSLEVSDTDIVAAGQICIAPISYGNLVAAGMPRSSQYCVSLRYWDSDYGVWESPVYDSNEPRKVWNYIQWNETLEGGTTSYFIRASDDSSNLGGWSGPLAQGSIYAVGRYCQLKVEIKGVNTSVSWINVKTVPVREVPRPVEQFRIRISL